MSGQTVVGTWHKLITMRNLLWRCSIIFTNPAASILRCLSFGCSKKANNKSMNQTVRIRRLGYADWSVLNYKHTANLKKNLVSNVIGMSAFILAAVLVSWGLLVGQQMPVALWYLSHMSKGPPLCPC